MRPRPGTGWIPAGWDRLEADYLATGGEAEEVRRLTLTHGGSWDEEAETGTILYPGPTHAVVTLTHASLWDDGPMPLIEVPHTGSV